MVATGGVGPLVPVTMNSVGANPESPIKGRTKNATMSAASITVCLRGAR